MLLLPVLPARCADDCYYYAMPLASVRRKGPVVAVYASVALSGCAEEVGGCVACGAEGKPGMGLP